MEAKQQLQFQRIVFDYFEKVDNKTLMDVIDGFIYGQTNISKKASDLFEKFLDDNGLTSTYCDFVYDESEEGKARYFRKSNLSAIQMIEQLKWSFLNLSYNRLKFGDIVVKKAKKETTIKEANKIKFRFEDDEESEIHILSNLNEEYTICGIYTDGDHVSDVKLSPKGKTDCIHYRDLVNMCKSIKL